MSLSRTVSLIARLCASKRGNVLMIFAFALIPMAFATGMGIDYSRAARLQTKLNAIADAAALSAVTQPMMKETDEGKVGDAALAMFNAQAGTLSGLDGVPIVSISITHPDGPNSRHADVSYTANSINAFGGVLHMRSIAIGGSSTAKAIAAPDMDFYLALDTSPSMALPTTTAGFQTMDGAVTCAFACHSNKIEQYVPSSLPNGLILDSTKYAIVKGAGLGTTGGGTKQLIDSNGAYVYVNSSVTDTIGSNLKAGGGATLQSLCRQSSSNNKNICVYNADGTFVDSYWYALNQGVRLRVTDERAAVIDLMALAQTYATENSRVYRAALYTFDHSTDLKTIVASPTDLATVSTAANKVDVVTVNDKAGNGRPPNGNSGSEYLFTSFKSILDKMGTVLPAKSGTGTRAPGDTPQAFLFLVTDGMSDEDIGSGRTRAAMQTAQINQCTAIKNRGVKIAILYTEYTVASIQDDEPGQREIARKAIEDNPTIASRLTACASPDLLYTVKTDESISVALQALFARATASARLIQ